MFYPIAIVEPMPQRASIPRFLRVSNWLFGVSLANGGTGQSQQQPLPDSDAPRIALCLAVDELVDTSFVFLLE